MNFRGNFPAENYNNKKLSYRRETAHVFLGSLTDCALHWTLHLLYNLKYITD